MVDLKGQYQKIKPEIDSGIQEVIDSTAFIKGAKVEEFRKDLEAYLHVKHVIPVGNGTDALQIALMALGLRPGDEVITPTFTFIATAEVVALLGLVPVFVDVDPYTFHIDPVEVEKAITPRTRAIVPVHLFGQNARMEELLFLALKHELFIVEDACQSIGSEYTFSDGSVKKSGCMGHIGCTSFFPSKNLGCFGDGGALFTNDDELARKMRSIANHGMEQRYFHDLIGVNSRLDSIQAAILDVKLKYLDEYNQARLSAADVYDKSLSAIKQLKVPARTTYSTHVFHQYTLRLEGVDRQSLIDYLAQKDIPVMIYYPVPLHLQKAYLSNRYLKGNFPVSEKLCSSVISLPMHTELSLEQINYICSEIINFLNKQTL